MYSIFDSFGINNTQQHIQQQCHVLTLTGPCPLTTADRLAQLPSEMLFDILCRLNALDLSRVAQANKFYSKVARDNALWRVKSLQHPLFSEQHLLNRKTVHWLSYFQFLHRNSTAMKQNWANARPQAVHVLEGHTGLVSSIEMSTWSLVTASIDSTLRVWDLRTLQCIQVLRSSNSLTCVSQSEVAGAACARTSFGALCIWDIKSGELILQDDTAMPQIASFIYMDERFIGYGQCDGVVTVFDWSSRTSLKVIGTYQAHEGDVIHVSVLDNKYVISASTNGETLVYSLAQSRIVERILLPHATQAIQFTPTIHGDKVMFSTRDAVYEYELLLDTLSSRFPTDPVSASTRSSTALGKQSDNIGTIQDSQDQCTSSSIGSGSSRNPRTRSQVALSAPVRQTATASRAWKTSNSLLSQIRQKIGTGRREPNEDMDPSLPTDFDQPCNQPGQQQQLRPITIPTRFPRLASIYCLPRTCRNLDHGTTSARDSYGVFMPNNCTRLDEISVYTRITKQIRQIRGPAVEEVLSSAVRNPFYTTMECNQHCAVVSSGNKVYVISFLPLDV
ncbi:hypothetical protein BG000_002418 [Podila horticola]|nr:hypothetical protein BG000_002418 [Podila horticola]